MESNKSSNPYLYPSEKPLIRKKPTESYKWPFKNEPANKDRYAKRSLKSLMDAECEQCSDCVRNCECFECPFWGYRSKANKIHRAYIGKLRKTETISEEEYKEVVRVYKSDRDATARVLNKVAEHCPSKLRTFIVANHWNARTAAVAAYEVFMANYDLSMVESLEGGSL